MHISIKAESLQNFIGLPITNSILATFLLLSILLLLVFAVKSKKLKLIPTGIQNILEIIIDALDNLARDIAGVKARVFLPFFVSSFLFILLSNYLGLLPGFGSIGFWEELHGEKILVPLFRGPTADLNTTIALALSSVFLIQFWGVKYLKLGYFSKFINFKGPIDFFVGILELISEIAKIISFAFRLFGNIFAGEVLLTVISMLTFGIATSPFMGLEIFVGFIQALVFALLTLVFMQSATQHHE
jgi:F-type H+-transporting ATPase subunit a